MQAVIADTEHDVASIQGQIDRLLADDTDWRALVSQVCQYSGRADESSSGMSGSVRRERIGSKRR